MNSRRFDICDIPTAPAPLATSRNIGSARVKGDIIAFVDDDAYPRENWLAELMAQYADPNVGAVGGRVDNGWPGEEIGDETQIGRFHPNGTIDRKLLRSIPAARLRSIIMIGANMSYRRQVLLDNGGIHDAYPGTCLREDSDTSLASSTGGVAHHVRRRRQSSTMFRDHTQKAIDLIDGITSTRPAITSSSYR